MNVESLTSQRSQPFTAPQINLLDEITDAKRMGREERRGQVRDLARGTGLIDRNKQQSKMLFKQNVQERKKQRSTKERNKQKTERRRVVFKEEATLAWLGVGFPLSEHIVFLCCLPLFVFRAWVSGLFDSL